RTFEAATALLAVSDEVAQYLESFRGAHGKVCVLPNAINPERFPRELAASLPAAPGTFTVGFVGSMKPWHGLSSLLEAFAKLHERGPETRLLLVGDGPERKKLTTEAAARGLGKAVQFMGAVAPHKVPGLLASMDVAVAPYPKLTSF